LFVALVAGATASAAAMTLAMPMPMPIAGATTSQALQASEASRASQASPAAPAATMPAATTAISLTLPEITGRAFTHGGVIEVPDNTALTRVDISVAASEAKFVNDDEVFLELQDGTGNIAVMAGNVTVVTLDGAKIARFKAPDVTNPVMVSSGAELRVRGYVRRRKLREKSLSQEWTLRAGSTRFISEQAGDRDGERLTIAIDEPIAEPILSTETAETTVDVKGRVTPARGLTRLTVGGVAIAPDRTEASQAFATTMVANAQTRELVVEAEDSFGRIATVVIPIAAPGARRRPLP
jgi:hypothetical protein